MDRMNRRTFVEIAAVAPVLPVRRILQATRNEWGVPIIDAHFHYRSLDAALAQLGIEWMYQERRGRKPLLAMLLVILGLTLWGEFSLLPKVRELHAIKYARPTAYYTEARRDEAAASFKRWHAVSQVTNLFVLGGLVVYLINMSRLPDTARFVRPPQFRS